jgi:hypothetical protein
MKKLMLAGLIALGTFGVVATTPTPAAAADCSVVLCPVCPTGTVASPTPGNCCRCVKP